MPENEDDWRAVSKRVKAPLVTFGMLGGRAKEDWRALGFSLIIDPFTAQVLAVEAIQNAYGRFMETGQTGREARDLFAIYNKLDELAGFEEFYKVEDATTEKTKQGR